MPERIRNTQLRRLISDNPLCLSRPRAIPHVNNKITVVRIAVARVESMPATPTFANRAVAAANNADSSAQNTHVMGSEYLLELNLTRRPIKRKQFQCRNYR